MVRYIGAAIFLSWTSSAFAAEYRIPVEDPNSFNTDDEIQHVLIQLSESMTGLSRSMLESKAPDLFALPEALVNSYGFGDSEFIIDLDQEGLKVRLLSAGIELWEGDRPKFLVWATEERGLERVMIGIEPHPVVDHLLKNGMRFGISLRRPLMDLDDTLALSAAEIWGQFEGAVEQASKRYNVSQIIVVGDRPEKFNLRYWLIDSSNQITSGEVSGETAEDRVEQFMDILLRYARTIKVPDKLIPPSKTDNAMLPVEQAETDGLIIQIQYKDMLRLMDLVDYLDIHDLITISELIFEQGVVNLRITTDLTLEQTDQIMTGFESVRFVKPQMYTIK